MDRGKRRARRLVIGACTAGCIAVLASPASADGGIARPPGAVDGRGYELVSQADKNGNQVALGIVPSVDGDHVLYSVHGGLPGVSSGNQPQLIAGRTPSGWATHSVLPPREELLGTHYLDVASSPDLGGILAGVFDGLGGPPGATDEQLVQLDGQGGQTLLHDFPTFQGITAIAPVASDDLRHVYANVDERIDPSQVAGTFDVYDFASTPPQLVSRMPGTGQAPACGIADSGSAPGFSPSGVSQHQVSNDGSRIYFATQGANCSGPVELYLHDRGSGQTVLVSGPVLGGTDRGIAKFLGATPDGGEAFYVTATTFAASDSTDGDDADLDVYRYDAASATTACVTCVVPNARVSSDAQDNAIVSEDGSHVYFLSEEQLLPGAVAGAENVYVVHGGVLGFVGIGLDGTAARLSSVAGVSSATSELSPDGRSLVFMSDRPEMNAISAADNGGRRQYYRYDDATATVACVSCPPGVMATGDVDSDRLVAGRQIRPDLHAMSADGSVVVFATPDALVPQDVNGGVDIYEWHDGTVGLVTDGVTRRTDDTPPKVLDVSPDGRDVFFADAARLTWDAQDDTFKVYDARAGGGFPAPASPPAPCDGDACHGAPTPAPQLGDDASARTHGAGDVHPTVPAFSVAKLGARPIARFARGGILTLHVRVGRPGRISVVAQARIGKRVARVAAATRTARHAGDLTLPLRLSKAARRRLAAAGRLTVVLGIEYSERASARRIVLHLTARSGRRHHR